MSASVLARGEVGGSPVGPASWRDGLAPRVALAVGVLVYTLAVSVGFVWRADTAATLLVAAGLTAPWLVSHLRPRLCFALMAVTTVVQLVLDLDLTPANLLVFPAVYAVADLRGRTDSLVATAVVVAGSAVAAARWGEDFSSSIVPFLAASGSAVTAWSLGRAAALRRAYAESLARRADQLEREHAHLAQLAAAHERSRIARDLHDIISHSMAGILTLSEATLRQDDLAQRHRDALELIASSCRGSLDELRRLLRLLHEQAGRPDDERPGVSDVPALLLPFEVRGVATRFDASPRVESLPESLQVTLYRVAQEALTNIHKHAGDDVRSVTVSLRIADDEVDLAVVDDGRGATAATRESSTVESGGYGIQGMRERVGLLDGTLSAGPGRDGRGFTVRARVPLQTPALDDATVPDWVPSSLVRTPYVPPTPEQRRSS